MDRRITQWKVCYGDEEQHEVTVPHAWRQDVDVRYEGPAVYRAKVSVLRTPSVLWFEGVSYEAKVSIEGQHVLTHCGIWDSFEVPLNDWLGKTVEVKVEVVKNGGARYPVRDVASGFIPYVYHTFGGIWGRVEIRPAGESSFETVRESRVEVDGARIFLDGRPFYIRGILHWGWYPTLGHHNPSEEVIRKEVWEAKRLGFNLVKFCLWVPPERYLEVLREEGMEAWIELPIWNPTSDPDKLETIAEEMARVVRQYRHHDNVIVWTVGCELSHGTPPSFREYLTQLVQNLTGCPLVKDNSGGAEMYGGDLREFGSFYDFHPYCDTQFYPTVLDSLAPGAREEMPTLLGEFNDIDVHRNLPQLHDEMPYWASQMPELNDQGVRWQYDLPGLLQSNPIAAGDDMARHGRLERSSREKAIFIRKYVQEAVRARDCIGGYVITGMRDTPISTAGFFDDWDRPRFSRAEVWDWNGPDVMFLIPTRRPPWTDGGNRPGWMDPYNQFVGQIFFKVGIHSEAGLAGGLTWRILDHAAKVVARGAEPTRWIEPAKTTQTGQISWDCEVPGLYELEVEFGAVKNSWKFHVDPKVDLSGFQVHDPRSLLGAKEPGSGGAWLVSDNLDRLAAVLREGGRAVAVLESVGTKPAPFWRESAIEFRAGAPFEGEWERLLAVSGDRVLDFAVLESILPEGWECETMMNRVDVRTYQESPIMIQVRGTQGAAILTTLRPHGGLGIQPRGLNANAAGSALLGHLLEMLK